MLPRPVKRELGDEIRSVRESYALSAVQLARSLQVTPQSVSNWETGRARPALGTLLVLARLLEMSEAEDRPRAVVALDESRRSGEPLPILYRALFGGLSR